MDFDFNEHQEVDSLDKVPTDFRGLYVETEDGKYRLGSDNEGVKGAVSAVQRLNKALKAARAEARANKEKGAVDLSALADFGQTPEEIKENIDKALAEAKKNAKASGNEDMQRQIEKIKQDLAQAHKGDLEKRDKRIEALTGRLYNVLVRGEAKSALASANAVDPELALPFLERQIKVAEEDGEFKVQVVDEAGDVRYSGVTGAPMSVKELVAEMKGNDRYAPLFKSDAPAGGGASPGGPRRPAPAKGDRDNMSSLDKISAGLNKGQHQSGRAAARRGPG